MHTHIQTFNRYYILDRLAFFIVPIVRFIINYVLGHYQESDKFDVEAPDILSYYSPDSKLFRNYYYHLYIQDSETNGTFLDFRLYRTNNPSQFRIDFTADFGPGRNELRYIALELTNVKRVPIEEAEEHFDNVMTAFFGEEELPDPADDNTEVIEIDAAAYMDKLYEENDFLRFTEF